MRKKNHAVNIAICDDDKKDAAYIESLLLVEKKVSCDVYLSGYDLLKYIQNNTTFYDVYFLDIEMPGINGINTAQEIRKRDQKALIVYVTNHQDYVYDVFETLPFRFLKKPITSESLHKVWYDIIEYFHMTKQVFLFTQNRIQCQIFTNEILYLESHGRVITLHAEKEKYDFYGRIYKLAETLNSNLFMQPHSSYLVNMDYIFSITNSEIVLRNNIIIPITFKYKLKVQQDYLGYVKWRHIR